MATIRIPPLFRADTQNNDELSIPGDSVRDVLANLAKTYPGIGARLFDPKGRVRPDVSIFHNDEDIRFLRALDTPVTGSDWLTVLSAVSGG